MALLSYLATTGQAHSRSALAGLLWGDMSEAKARANLSRALSTLRPTVGDYLTTTRHQVAFDSDERVWVDVTVFEEGVQDHSPVRLREAIQWYRGDFLADFAVYNAPEFEHWVLGQQARLKGLALEALQTLSVHFTEQGGDNIPQAMTYTTRLLELEPWREEAHRQLMALLMRQGKRREALGQYEKCKQMLAEELGVEPGPETISIYEQIRDEAFNEESLEGQHHLSPETRPGHNLPNQITSFLGREAEMAELDRLLVDPNIRLVTVIGPGGIGKTRLALETACRLKKRYNDGIYWISLAEVTTEAELIKAFAKVLGYQSQAEQSSWPTLIRSIDNKQSLFLFDNFEHLMEYNVLLTDILQKASNIKMIVTSRERLNLQGEWILDLGGLEIPPKEAGQSQPLEQYSAVKLFLHRAVQVQPGFEINEGNKVAIIQICTLLQGSPLAIELATALLRVISCKEIVQEIKQSLHVLTTALHDVPPRHQSLRAVFEHSWQLLSPTEQRVLAQLSIFRRRFTRKAALAVAEASLVHLTTLINKSLIYQSQTGTYEIHEVVRQFAFEKLAEMGQARQMRAKLEAYFIALTKKDMHQFTHRGLHPNDKARSDESKQPVAKMGVERSQKPNRRILMISPQLHPYHVEGGVGKHVAELVNVLGKTEINDRSVFIDLLVPSLDAEDSVESISPTVTIYHVAMVTPQDASFSRVLGNNSLLIKLADRLIQHYDYDLLHIHESPVSEAGIHLQQTHQLPLIVTIHITARRRFQESSLPEIDQIEQRERLICQVANKIIVTSRFMKQEIQNYVDPYFEKIQVIPNGISERVTISRSSKQWHQLRQAYAPDGQKLLYFVGPTTYEKGLLTLIRAMPEILSHYPDVHLLVASRHGHRLQPLAHELYVDQAISFLGFISDAERDTLYQIVDITIIPSIYEPFGLVALEAMAFGSNVIASNTGGLSEVIKHRQTGLLVAPDDPNAIAQAVNDFFANQVSAQQWRENALQEIETFYRWETVAQQTARLYEKLLLSQRVP